MKNQFRSIGITAFLLISTLLINPFRAYTAQDDSIYVHISQAIASGDWSMTQMALASAWPQTLLGAALLKILPFHPFLVLTGLTWIVFSIFILKIKKQTTWSLAALIGFFSFPLFFQYGASYLTDIYALFLVSLFAMYVRRVYILKKTASLFVTYVLRVSVVVVIILLSLQRQVFISVPAFFGVAFLFFPASNKKLRSEGLTFIIGVILSLILYKLLPGSQQPGFLLNSWISYWSEKPLVSMGTILFWVGQFYLALGLLLIPLVQPLNKKSIIYMLGIQCAVSLAVYFLTPYPLTAGILFTDYLPRFVGSALVSFGVWGFFAVRQRQDWTVEQVWSVRISLISILPIFLLFAIFRASDLKYALPASALFLIFLPAQSQSANSKFSCRAVYAALVFTVSIFANRYNLDTVGLRWRAAAELENTGVQKREISAGYGRDQYELGPDCVNAGTVKTESRFPKLSKEWRDALTPLLTARPFEYGWVPKYTIKPSRILYKSLHLPLNPNATYVSAQVYSYSVFGFPFEITVYKTDTPKESWCFAQAW